MGRGESEPIIQQTVTYEQFSQMNQQTFRKQKYFCSNCINIKLYIFSLLLRESRGVVNLSSYFNIATNVLLLSFQYLVCNKPN